MIEAFRLRQIADAQVHVPDAQALRRLGEVASARVGEREQIVDIELFGRHGHRSPGPLPERGIAIGIDLDAVASERRLPQREGIVTDAARRLRHPCASSRPCGLRGPASCLVVGSSTEFSIFETNKLVYNGPELLASGGTCAPSAEFHAHTSSICGDAHGANEYGDPSNHSGAR